MVSRLLTCRVVRRVLLRAALLFFVAACSSAGEPGQEPGIDVIDVSGPLDASALEFMSDSIEAAAETGQELAVLQINSRAVLDRRAFTDLLETMEKPPLPVAVWVGPAPAVAGGGAAQIATMAEHAAISPGSSLGPVAPVILGEAGEELALDEAIPADETGLDLQPTLRQYLQDLDGETFQTANGPVTVETVAPFRAGVTLKPVTFLQPGLGVRFFRLAATPEAAFFYLVVGLAIATFEFFAIGPGVAAGVAALSLLLAGWGIVNLPVRPWAVGLALVGWALLTAAYQKGGVVALTLLGAVMLQVGGTFLVDGSGQIDPRWYLVLPSVLAVLFFFLLAMPTVQRARFSTRTIGRDRLTGEHGFALERFDPDGVVEVGGARWRATAHREAGLSAGSEILVAGVDGMFLEVEPVADPREN
jgi:membrane-bound ClpP family serine protease